MADEILRSKHGFGALEDIDAALSQGKIDAFDILFVKDANGKPYIGWIDKDGNKVIVEEEEKVIHIKESSLPDVGEEGKIYILGEDGYFWDGEKFVSLSKSADLTALEEEISKKADAEEVDVKISEAKSEAIATSNSFTDDKVKDISNLYERIKYEISYKPDGTLVDYREEEIRIMCPSDTEWQLQNSGEGANPNSYYIGFKAYAPASAVSFKEDTAKTISDTTMYYFENNEFAGVDTFGRKYSIVWLPVAVYDEATSAWTYHGTNSTSEKYIGWYYSVEWYDENGKIIDSDCIRINLANEDCYSSIEPFYVNSTLQSAKSYTDDQIAKVTSGVEIVEF